MRRRKISQIPYLAAQPGGASCGSPWCIMASEWYPAFSISAMVLVEALLMESATAGEKRRSRYSGMAFWWKE